MSRTREVAKAMGMVQALQEALGKAQELLERRDEVDDVKLQEMALTLKNASDKVAAEIDNIEADTAKKLAEAKAVASQALMARAVNPTAPNA
jgi:molecular chaperone GrpE (heat shock protein)